MRGILALLACAACTVGEPGAAQDAGDPDASAPDAGPPGELRGVWITRFGFADAASLEAVIDRAAAAHFNAVFVQIRGQGDAYYRSTYEPWSARLSGVLGRDPGWDPLQVAIDRAHAHGLELHAYFNVFSAWTAEAPPPLAEGPVQHPLRDHPDWLAVDSTGTNRDGEYRWFAPGNPAVRAHIVATARELLARYDVDGLHLDRIRTAGADYSHDPVSEARFDDARADDPSLTWGDFMRGEITATVAALHDAVAELRPGVPLSAAVWGIYEALPGCATSQGYAGYHQDSLGWLDAGAIDALAPMIYWPIEPGTCTDWSALLAGFVARRGDGQIWAGSHALDDDAWDFAAVRARIEDARAQAAQGVVLFASSYLDADPARWDAFVGTAEAPGPYFEPAGAP